MLAVSIILSMILANNYVLAQFLGICPFLGVSKKMDSAVGMGGAVVFVMVLATAVTWPIQQILNKFHIDYLQTVICTANRNDVKEVYASALQLTWSIPTTDHNELCSTWCMYR